MLVVMPAMKKRKKAFVILLRLVLPDGSDS